MLEIPVRLGCENVLPPGMPKALHPFHPFLSSRDRRCIAIKNRQPYADDLASLGCIVTGKRVGALLVTVKQKANSGEVLAPRLMPLDNPFAAKIELGSGGIVEQWPAEEPIDVSHVTHRTLILGPMRATLLKPVFLFVGGAAVLSYLVGRTGTATIGEYLNNLGIALVVPLFLVGVQHCLRAFAWRFPVRAMDLPLKYLDLWRARLGAEALGYLSFTGAIGAQTSKVLLLCKGISARAGAATVAVDAAASGIAGVLFVGTALLTCQPILGLPSLFAAIGGVFLGIGAGAWLLAGIWASQRRHHVELPDMAEEPTLKLEAARDSMRLIRVGLVRLHGIPFAMMIIIHFAGHLALAAATWSILPMLGINGNTILGLWFETGAKLGNTLGVLVPARLGVFEAGLAASANILDLNPAAGIAIGLVRRVIDTFWVAVGLSLTTLWPINLSRHVSRQ